MAENLKRSHLRAWVELRASSRSYARGASFFAMSRRQRAVALWREWRSGRKKSRAAIESSRSLLARVRLRTVMLAWAFWSNRSRFVDLQLREALRTRLETMAVASLRVWRMRAAKRASNRTLIGQTIDSIVSHRVRGALGQWRRASAAAIAARRERLDAALAIARLRRLSAAFRHLKLYSVVSKARSMAVATIFARHSLRAWRRGAFVGALREAALARALVACAAQRARRGLAAFRRLLVHAEARRSNNLRLARAMHCVHHFQVCRSLEAWRSAARARRSAKARLRRSQPPLALTPMASSSAFERGRASDARLEQELLALGGL